MNSRSELKLDWASHESAKYAATKWHYAKTMPRSKLAKIGVWESGSFKGVIIFGVGATADLVKRYGLTKQQGCELVRVALRGHVAPVSRMLSIAVKMIKREFPKLRLIVSFADPIEGHHGGIYQASGWVYSGQSAASDEYIFRGKRWQGRSFRNSYKGMENHPAVKKVKGSSKHRYLMPLDKEIAARIEPLRKPYPKRVKQAMTGPPAQRQGGTDPHAPTEAHHAETI